MIGNAPNEASENIRSVIITRLIPDRDESRSLLALTLFYLGGIPPPVFLHHPKMAQGIKPKLSDFKDKPLGHILQIKPVRYIFSCCHGNKITEGTLQGLAPKKSENQPFVKILS